MKVAHSTSSVLNTAETDSFLGLFQSYCLHDLSIYVCMCCAECCPLLLLLLIFLFVFMGQLQLAFMHPLPLCLRGIYCHQSFKNMTGLKKLEHLFN